MKNVAVLFLLLAFPALLSAQAPTSDQLAEMKKLGFLLGEWKGKSFAIHPNGKRDESTKSVKVQSKPDGSALLIKETLNFTSPLTNRSNSAVITTTISYDDEAKLYRCQWGGSTGSCVASITEPGTLQLEQTNSGTRIRTTISVSESGEWHETMEFWMNVRGWLKTQEDSLQHKK
jgi:hypothetical protein